MHALLVHGAGGGGWEWNVWRRVFAAHGIAASAPDLEAATAGLQATTLEDYRQQVATAARELPTPPVLVGASLGGLLALCTAVEVDAAALVLVNPLPPSPWHAQLRRRAWPPRVPWARDASLAGTRAALPDADAATCLFAWRRWRDDSGAVLQEASSGVAVRAPACPLLVIASGRDEDVPARASAELASAFGGDLLHCAGASHVGVLLGRAAPVAAADAARWLQAIRR